MKESPTYVLESLLMLTLALSGLVLLMMLLIDMGLMYDAVFFAIGYLILLFLLTSTRIKAIWKYFRQRYQDGTP